MNENLRAAENAYYDAIYAESLDAYGWPITDNYAAYCDIAA